MKPHQLLLRVKHVRTKHKTETVLREKLQIGLYAVAVVCFCFFNKTNIMSCHYKLLDNNYGTLDVK